MVGVDLKLKSGSFAGAVFPVDLDVAYAPDSDVEVAITGSAIMTYDKRVVAVVAGSISSGGSSPVPGVITWPEVTVPEGGGFAKLSAKFQWVDYHVALTEFEASFTSRETGIVVAPPLDVGRPSAPRGTKLKSLD